MKKTLIPVIVVFSLTGCTPAQNTPDAHPTSAAQTASNVVYPNVKLLSWNDFHSNIYEAKLDDGSALGGLPVFMAAVEQLRGDGLSILSDGGDMFQGAMPFNEAKGMGMVDVMNTLHIDFASIGNHEFDYAEGVVQKDHPRGAMYEAFAASHFPWVNANLVTTADNREPWPPQNLHPYVIIEKGPYRVGVIGLLTRETPLATKADNVKGLEFKPPAQALKEILPQVVAQKPDMIIVTAHLSGLPTPLPPTGTILENATFDGEIGEILALPDDMLQHIDLLLTGHSHKSFVAYQGDLTVVQSLSAGREITEMTLVGDKNGLHVDRSTVKKHYLQHPIIDSECGEAPKPLTQMNVGDLVLTPSEKGREIVQKYESRMAVNPCERMGCSDALIKRNYSGECVLGNLVTNALRAQYPDAEIAMQNAGGLRIDLPPGNIYRETLNSLMPFENYAYYLEMPGEDIARVLKVSSSLEHGAMQVSGLTYTIEAGCENPEDITGDGQIDAWENNCLCEQVLVNGKPLEKDRMYKVVTSDFLYKGGDALGHAFEHSKLVDKGPVIKDTIYRYVQSLNQCVSQETFVSKDAPRIVIGSCNGKYYQNNAN